jgi:hypothetical protein
MRASLIKKSKDIKNDPGRGVVARTASKFSGFQRLGEAAQFSTKGDTKAKGRDSRGIAK